MASTPSLNGSNSGAGTEREDDNGRSENTDGDDGTTENDSDIDIDEGGDTTVAYSMPESTASARYKRSLHENAVEEHAEARREYEHGDGTDWLDAMMRTREADY